MQSIVERCQNGFCLLTQKEEVALGGQPRTSLIASWAIKKAYSEASYLGLRWEIAKSPPGFSVSFVFHFLYTYFEVGAHLLVGKCLEFIPKKQ